MHGHTVHPAKHVDALVRSYRGRERTQDALAGLSVTSAAVQYGSSLLSFRREHR